MKSQGKKRLWIIVVVLVVLTFAGAIFVSRRLVYTRPPGDALATFLAAAYPFPAVKMGSMTITMKDYLIEYQALQNSFSFMQAEESPAPEELQKVILQTLINKRVIAKLATDYGVEATPQRVDEYYQKTLAGETDEQAFAQELETTFGWTTAEFKRRVIEPIVLAIDTNTYLIQSPDVQADRQALIDAAHARITNGEDFATVAQEVMTPFGLNKYDLGFFKMSELPTAWRSSVEARGVNEVTEVLQSNEVFAFLKVIERIADFEDSQVHLMTVSVPKKTVQDAVKEYLASVEVKKYLGT